MNFLSVESITKSYSEKVLLDKISFGINQGEKIAVIGINGTGKSTLLKIIAGIEEYDTGNILKVNNLRIEYLEQSPNFESGTVLEQVFKGDSVIMKTLREYEKVVDLVNLKGNEYNKNTSFYDKKLMELTDKIDSLSGWNIESEAKSILTKLGINDFYENVKNLSGGQKKRIAMASALISPADLLILDEPTNHIDNEFIDWLEKYLNARNGALLMVTHDRYFLERVANKIIEIDFGRVFTYQANYSKFLELKIEREEQELSSERKRQNIFRRELEWIRRGAKARSTKQKARIDRFNSLKDQKGVSVESEVEIKTITSRIGKKIIEFKNIYKKFDKKIILEDFSYNVLRDDRIGIIGMNGIGKSTLLKMLTNKVEIDSGEIIIGDTIKIGFFSQENEELNSNLRVIECIKEVAEIIETSEGTLSASQMLEKFLFPPQVQWTPISKLSGGEKRRLYLLKILMSSPNVLLLDEPTNDLDIKTLTILEEYIDNFSGPVIAVSHDRYFLDRMAEKIFSFEGNGEIKQYSGNYTDYTLKREIKIEQIDQKKKEIKPQVEKIKKLKMTFNELREFEQIDEKIEKLEEELVKINEKIEETSSDFVSLQKLIEEKEEIVKNLDIAMERWTYLNELNELIQKQ